MHHIIGSQDLADGAELLVNDGMVTQRHALEVLGILHTDVHRRALDIPRWGYVRASTFGKVGLNADLGYSLGLCFLGNKIL